MSDSKVFAKAKEVATMGDRVMYVLLDIPNVTTKNLKEFILNNIHPYTVIKLGCEYSKPRFKKVSVSFKKDAGTPQYIINIKHNFKSFDEYLAFEEDFNNWILENNYC